MLLILNRISADIDALKKLLPTQAPSKSEIYMVVLKAGREEMRVDIKFTEPDGSPEVTSVSGKGPYELSFDIVCLHRYYDTIELEILPILPPAQFFFLP